MIRFPTGFAKAKQYENNCFAGLLFPPFSITFDFSPSPTPGPTMILNELAQRNLPDVLTPEGEWNEQRRAEALDLAARTVFGHRPPPPEKMEFKEYAPAECAFPEDYHDPDTLAYFKDGRAAHTKIRAVCHLSEARFPGLKNFPEAGGAFEFDVYCFLPKTAPGEKLPAVAAICGLDVFTTRALPVKLLMEKRVAVFAFRYRHIVNDYPERINPDKHCPEFDNTGLDRLFFGDFRLRDNPSARAGDDPGTIAFWSWGASRVMDYIQTQGARVDLSRVLVSGHSRLGKTALLTGALDTRFALAYPNGSGAAGACLSRGDRKQDLQAMTGWASPWFCENLKTQHNSPLYDMHFLMACVAPRKLYIGNSDQDEYCDHDSGYLACVAAGEAYKRMGLKGFVHPDRLPHTGDKLHDGEIGYHLRPGSHSFTAEDWTMMLEFFLK